MFEIDLCTAVAEYARAPSETAARASCAGHIRMEQWGADWPSQQDAFKTATTQFPNLILLPPPEGDNLLDAEYLQLIAAAVYRHTHAAQIIAQLLIDDKLDNVSTYSQEELAAGFMLAIKRTAKVPLDQPIDNDNIKMLSAIVNRRPVRPPAENVDGKNKRQREDKEEEAEDEGEGDKGQANKKASIDIAAFVQDLKQYVQANDAAVLAAAALPADDVEQALEAARQRAVSHEGEFKGLLLTGNYICMCRNDKRTWEYITDKLGKKGGKGARVIRKPLTIFNLIDSTGMYRLRHLRPTDEVLKTLKEKACAIATYMLRNKDQLQWWQDGEQPPPKITATNRVTQVQFSYVDARWLQG